MEISFKVHRNQLTKNRRWRHRCHTLVDNTGGSSNRSNKHTTNYLSLHPIPNVVQWNSEVAGYSAEALQMFRIALAGHSLLLLAAQLLPGFKDFVHTAEKKPYTISITRVNNT